LTLPSEYADRIPAADRILSRRTKKRPTPFGRKPFLIECAGEDLNSMLHSFELCYQASENRDSPRFGVRGSEILVI
jgi:hypothetical protein